MICKRIANERFLNRSLNADSSSRAVVLGPELAYRIEGNGSFIEPQVSMQGLWNFDQIGKVGFDRFVSSPDDFCGRVEAGLVYGRTGGMTFRAVGAYEGTGAGDFEMWSGCIWASIPLN